MCSFSQSEFFRKMEGESPFYSQDLAQNGLIVRGRVFQYFHWHQRDGDAVLTHHSFVPGSSLCGERRQRDGWDGLLPALYPGGMVCCLPCSPCCCFLLLPADVYRYFVSLTGVRKGIGGGIICGNIYLRCSWPHAFIIAERKTNFSLDSCEKCHSALLSA